MQAPLEGVRVLEVANWIAAPCAGAMMADLGAEVVKVEPPAGDSMRRTLRQARVPDGEPTTDHPFQLDNRGKRSIAVALDRPEGAALVRRLAGWADVLITNLVGERQRRYGLTWEELHEEHPGLVVARLSGYGSDGSEADRIAYDMTAFFARGGVASVITGSDGEPVHFRPGQGDHTTGLAVLGAVLAALRARERSGEGQLVDVSLLRAATWTVATDLSASLVDDYQPSARPRERTVSPLIEPFRCLDDRWIQFTMPHAARWWAPFCRAIGRADLIDDERFDTPRHRFEHNEELMGVLDDVFATRTRDEWAPLLDAEGLVWAPVNTLPDVVADPQVRAIGTFATVEHREVGTFETVAAPFAIPTADVSVRGPAPEVGEHTDEVLAALGLEAAEVARLRAEGVVGAAG